MLAYLLSSRREEPEMARSKSKHKRKRHIRDARFKRRQKRKKAAQKES